LFDLVAAAISNKIALNPAVPELTPAAASLCDTASTLIAEENLTTVQLGNPLVILNPAAADSNPPVSGAMSTSSVTLNPRAADFNPSATSSFKGKFA
jgi:hypothetical protein